MCGDHVRTDSSFDKLSDHVEQHSTGASDVSRAIRKTLKNGSPHAQKRALTILEALVESGSPKFQKNFADDRLVDRLRYLSQSEFTSPGVRRKLMLILLSWHRHFMKNPEMSRVANLYFLCGGVDRVPEVGHEHGEVSSVEHVVKPGNQPDIFVNSAGRLLSVEGVLQNGTAEANELIAAMKRVDRSQQDLLSDIEVQQHVSNVLDEQKSIVQFIHVVQDEEYLSRLIDTNDKLVDALHSLQIAATGGPVEDEPLGKQRASTGEADFATLAARRLSEMKGSGEGLSWLPLSRRVDEALLTNSGIATASASRGPPPEEYDTESEPDVAQEQLRVNSEVVPTVADAGPSPTAAVPTEPHAVPAIGISPPSVSTAEPTASGAQPSVDVAGVTGASADQRALPTELSSGLSMLGKPVGRSQ